MFARFARVIAATVAAGLLVGGAIGGVGGRLAMRVLAVTSDDSLRGRETDDSEIVGRITFGGSIGLIIFLAFGGAAIALTYLALRRWLPVSRPVRAAGFALLFFGIQGSQMFDPDSFDFTALEPHWLAVGMFVVILVGAGAATVVAVDWAVDHWPEFSNRTWYAYVPLLPLVLAFPIFVPIAIGGLVAYAIQTNDGVRRAWESRPVTMIGQVAIAVITAMACVPALAGVRDILA